MIRDGGSTLDITMLNKRRPNTIPCGRPANSGLGRLSVHPSFTKNVRTHEVLREKGKNPAPKSEIVQLAHGDRRADAVKCFINIEEYSQHVVTPSPLVFNVAAEVEERVLRWQGRAKAGNHKWQALITLNKP